MFGTKREGLSFVVLFKFHLVTTSGMASGNSLKYAGQDFPLWTGGDTIIPPVGCCMDHRMWGTSQSAGRTVDV